MIFKNVAVPVDKRLLVSTARSISALLYLICYSLIYYYPLLSVIIHDYIWVFYICLSPTPECSLAG